MNMRLGEFVALTAMMISLVALSIDAMLPALPVIGMDLGVVNANDNQLVVSSLFLGLAIGQFIYGPISDSTGRKPAIYVGLILFIFGCFLSIFATSYPVMLAGRVLQGIGVAGPRTITVAIVRDKYSGADMAKIMSFVMAVFIIVPTLAPAVGQGILMISTWRMIFAVLLAMAVICFVWFAVRQDETLPRSNRATLSFSRIFSAVRETCANRVSFGYTVAAGLVFGAFIGYLNSAQQIFQNQYGLGELFPVYFGALALSIGVMSFLNGKLVHRLGMHLLTLRALQLTVILSITFLGIGLFIDQGMPLWMFMTWALSVFLCQGVLFGNINALAMEPLGHIAGTGAAIVGSLTTFISLFFGTLIGQAYNGTTLPLIGGFAVLGMISLLVMRWINQPNH
ncbi:MAG: multidrug effflux MFS transporter [Rhodospirillales bacterium]|jgi:MFS transporter, DHA1 family, multidrug resistance protein|nr:multidrug effflux MFS transporter [Rhodospirillales bacterium]